LILVVVPLSSGTISLKALQKQTLIVYGPNRSHPFLMFDNLLPQSLLLFQPLPVQHLIMLRITKQTS